MSNKNDDKLVPIEVCIHYHTPRRIKNVFGKKVLQSMERVKCSLPECNTKQPSNKMTKRLVKQERRGVKKQELKDIKKSKRI